MITIDNFEEMIELNNCLLLSQSQCFLFGDKTTDVEWIDMNATSLQTAVVYSTENKGKTWNKTELGQGYINNSLLYNDEIYISKICTNKHQILDSTIVYQLNKKTRDWRLCFSLGKYIGDLLYMSDSYGLITAKKENQGYVLYESYDKGKNWREVISKYTIYRPIFDNNHVWYLSSSGPRSIHNAIMRYDIGRKNDIMIEYLPEGFDGYFLYEYKDVLYVVGCQNGAIKLYKHNLNGQFELIYQLNSNEERIFPKELHIFGNEIFLYYGKRKSGYIEYCLIKSNDLGKTWESQFLKNPLHLDPIGFYDDNVNHKINSWIYSGGNRIQIVE
ncbi:MULTISPECIES: hypothetical protein [Chitinophagaceae]